MQILNLHLKCFEEMRQYRDLVQKEHAAFLILLPDPYLYTELPSVLEFNLMRQMKIMRGQVLSSLF